MAEEEVGIIQKIEHENRFCIGNASGALFSALFHRLLHCTLSILDLDNFGIEVQGNQADW